MSLARRSRVTHYVGALLAPLALAACSDSPTTPLSNRALAGVAANDAPTIPIYGNGALRRATPKSPCRTGHYRDFDFWVGDWNVSPSAGAPTIAASHIALDLDGCAVLENWMPLNGVRGRSLNSYDAESGVWRQTWVPEVVGFGTPLRMAGNVRPDGVMAMTGQRIFAATGWPFLDAYTWTPVDADHVVQAFTLDIPPINFHSGGSLSYARTTTLPATSSPGTVECQVGGSAGENRHLDFTVGTWRVAADHGPSLGTSVIAIDPALSGCLIEERFTTPKGYRAIGWLYYDPIVDAYYRSYVDSEGDRVEMRGTVQNGALVLEGSEPVPGASGARVRLTWLAVGPNELRQRWETSRDGTNWRSASEIVFTK